MSRRNKKFRAKRAYRSRQNKMPAQGPLIDWIRKLIGGILDPFLPKKTSMTGAIPGAYQNNLQPRFRVFPGENGVRIRGCDLVTSVPSEVTSDSNFIFTAITCNPCYWSGTRIAQVGAMYMNYRPIKMVFCYVPQVAVTQQGTVVMGTVWNGSAPTDNLQQTLFTSNGGMMTQCYSPAVTEVKLGSNLPQNVFNTNGPLSQDTNPFMFLAASRGADVVPGYFYVMYEYEFKNALGQAWQFGVNYKTRTSALSNTNVDNISVVPLSQYGQYGPGTIFGYDRVAGRLTYNNRLVNYSLTGPVNQVTNVAVYYNQQQPIAANDDPIDPDPQPTPGPGSQDATYNFMIRWVDTINEKQYIMSIAAIAPQVAAYTFYGANDGVEYPAHSGYYAYVFSQIQYLGFRNVPKDTPEVTSTANVRYWIIIDEPRGTPRSSNFPSQGYWSCLGYTPIKQYSDASGALIGNASQFTRGITLSRGTLSKMVALDTEEWEVVLDQNATAIWLSYSFNLRTDVPNVNELNAYYHISNDAAMQIEISDTPSTIPIEQ